MSVVDRSPEVQPAPPVAERLHDARVSLDEHSHSAPVVRSIPKPPGVNAQSRIVWPYLAGVGLVHALLPLCFLPYYFSWWGVLWVPLGNYLFCSLGVGAGYHRLLTHRGYKCPRWFEHTLAILGVCNLQESPARWVLTHRMHHRHSDHQPDPHTPMVGFWWSHMSWLFIENRDTRDAEAYDKYARDILRDPFYFALERNYLYYWVVLGQAAAFFLAGLAVGYGVWSSASMLQVGLQWLLWGVVARTVYTWHVTWAVNSVAHLWGYRNYSTRENSRNNWIVALATNGEGWHNNHHAQPRAAAHGHRWWELDVTFATLCVLERLGLVWDIVRPIPAKNEDAQ